MSVIITCLKIFDPGLSFCNQVERRFHVIFSRNSACRSDVLSEEDKIVVKLTWEGQVTLLTVVTQHRTGTLNRLALSLPPN